LKRAVAVPVRPLLALAAAVLAAHLFVLRGTGVPMRVSATPPARPFTTRSVVLERPAPAAAAPDQPTRPPSNPPATRRPTAAVRPVERPATSASEQAPVLTPAAQPGPLRPAGDFGAQPIALKIASPRRLHYSVVAQLRGQARSGEATLVWRHDGDSYEAKLEISAAPLPLRTQHSVGRITAEGLAPSRFSDKARGEAATHFERDQGKVSFSNNRPDAPLLAGAQDRLSVLLQLGAMMAGAPEKFPAGATIFIQTAGTSDAEPWLFTVGPQEMLHLPGGAATAVKLTREPRREYDQRIELWLAPGMDYAPVRLRLTQPNGDSVDHQWSSTDRG
jgi:hypothetical protein